MSLSFIQAEHLRIGVVPQAFFGKDIVAVGIDSSVDDVDPFYSIYRFDGAPYFRLGASNGSAAAPTNLIDGQSVGIFEFMAYAGGWYDTAFLSVAMDGAPAGGIRPASRFEFWTNVAGGSRTLRGVIKSNGLWGLGTNTPEGILHVAGERFDQNDLYLQCSVNSVINSVFYFRKSRGTLGLPSPIVVDDYFGSIAAEGWNGTSWSVTASIRFKAGDYEIGNTPPSTIEFWNNAEDAIPSIAMDITPDSAVNVYTLLNVKKASTYQPTTLAAVAGLVAIDAAAADFFRLTVNGNVTLSNPTNAATGRRFFLRTTSNSDGYHTLSFGTKFRFAGVVPGFSSAPNSVDYFAFIYDEADDKWDYQPIGQGGSAGGVIVLSFTHAQLQAAALVKNIEAFSLPAKGKITGMALKTRVAFSGGAIATYTLSVGLAGDLEKYVAAFDVKQATGDRVLTGAGLAQIEDFGAATSIRLSAESTGANLNQSAAGTVDLWIEYTVLP